jgi:signal transduction histidine kinase/CHASE2 domain-containing sensor protein
MRSRTYKSLTSLYLALVCVGLLAVLDITGVFVPASRWVYDQASHVAYHYYWEGQAAQAGVYQKRPVLIAIDEPSLQSIGRWPWARSVHARLLDRLGQGRGAGVVAMDIVFAEPQLEGVLSVDTDEDAALAQAINRSPFPVLLATQSEKWGEQIRLIQPREPLSTTVAKIAHAQIDVDVDGSVRRYWPVDNQMPGLRLPYLGRAMLVPTQAPRIGSDLVTSAKSSVGDSSINLTERLYPLPNDWAKELSYQAVLSGEIKKEVWAGLPILVAATARGLGDQYVSHVNSPSKVIAGGEVVLAAFHTEKLLQIGFPSLRDASLGWHWFSVLVVVGGLLLGLQRSATIGAQLLLVAISLLLGSGIIMFVFAIKGVWFNAAELGFAVVLTWAVWASHTLQRLLGFLFRRLKELQSINGSALGETSKRLVHGGIDAIDEKLWAADALELLRKTELVRLREVLEMLPDSAFVLTIEPSDAAQVRLSVQNRAARQLAQRFPFMKTALMQPVFSFNSLLAEFNADLTEQQQTVMAEASQAAFEWQHLLELRWSGAFEHGVQSNASQSGRFLIKLAYLSHLDASANLLTVVLSVVDLSVGLALDEARNRTLNFLSHDLRAPQATILALIELEAHTSPENAELFSKIQFQSERTLQLAEGFVQLSQASHSAAYNMVEYNLNDLMIEALDEQWATAKQKGIVLKGQEQTEDLWVELDRNLMWRALVNLINNALNACENSGSLKGEVCLSVRRDGLFGVIEVRDSGLGISIDKQANLFQAFVQGHGLKRTGAGLGLAFVKAVLDQHSGQVRVISPIFESPKPHGTKFELWIPLLND